MPKPNRLHVSPRAARAALWVALAAAGLALYARGAPANPPGFFIDESSVAYNAHTLAQSGRDEHGEPWPLYFRAFGDYKNPTYVYLLAGVFRVTGPSAAAARYLSAALGVLAALALGLLGARVTGRAGAGLLTCLTALLTPWLFELSRVVLEVAAYPLAVALLLLSTRRAARGAAWGLADSAAVAGSLALVTYTYSTGRLFGPLLTAGLALLCDARARLRPLLTTWALYALSLVPLLVYHRRNPEALTKRFSFLTYVTPESGYAEDAWEFVRHFAANLNPWRMLVTGDVNKYQIASVPGTGVVLLAAFALALAGAWLAFRGARRDAWWRFFLYGLAASVAPASLTNDYFHMLRLAALPVFLVALCAPAFAWLLEGGRGRRAALAALVALTLLQGAHFRRRFELYASDPWRLHMYDADYAAKLLPAALAASPREIHLADSTSVPGYIQALWHGAAWGLRPETFVTLDFEEPPPAGAVVITTEDVRPRCRVLAESEPYTVCATEGRPRAPGPLPEGGFSAGLRAIEIPARVGAKSRVKVSVAVRNEGDALWPARERGLSPLQVAAANRWLDAAGRVVTADDGRGAIPRDLRPGDEAVITFDVNAPRRPGDYLLEIDMLQEGVTRFAAKGSQTLRVPVRVE
ncbi:MAG TPA: hypothetical protein VF668_05085 [Pyrinomonadaceae bacterium]|jgi:hypothetical protein